MMDLLIRLSSSLLPFITVERIMQVRKILVIIKNAYMEFLVMIIIILVFDNNVYKL